MKNDPLPSTTRTTSAQAAPGRLPFIDALKAIASQLIVLHHLAFYGPMSDYALPLAPQAIPWLYDYARIAVQVFLVMGGFFAAQTLARDGTLSQRPLPTLLWRRYLKLVLPYLGALLIAIVVAAIARQLMDNESIPEAPTLIRFIAHLLLLHGVLGFDGISAGAWYVAIDFQLFALLLLTLWLARRFLPRLPAAGPLLVVALMTVSLFHFNRDDSWDNWAIYFIGAYGMGATVYWHVRRRQAPAWLLLVALLAGGALYVEFRLRIAVALCVAVSLALARYTGLMESWPHSRLLAWLGKISYSVFLIHFSVCLLTNAVFERYMPHNAAVQLAGMGLAWLASVGAGALYHYQVELRAQSYSGRLRPAV